MRRLFYFCISLIVIAGAMASCSFETDTVDGDGDMEGMWHLESIERIVVDSTTHDSVLDLSTKRYFWIFQHDLMQLKDYDDGHTSLFGRFNIAGGTISLHDFYINLRAHDSLMTDLSRLAPYGIYSLTPTYNYNISSGRLTLTADSVTLRLKRF